MFPEEKTRVEVATMRFIGDRTSIPVPFVIHSGGKSESPSKLAAFVIMEYIDNSLTMLEIMKTPGRPLDERVSLDPEINPVKLQNLYKWLTKIHFSLSNLSQERIGSLKQIDDFTWEVAGRPLSLYINEMSSFDSGRFRNHNCHRQIRRSILHHHIFQPWQISIFRT